MSAQTGSSWLMDGMLNHHTLAARPIGKLLYAREAREYVQVSAVWAPGGDISRMR
jgi:hypothetical protein